MFKLKSLVLPSSRKKKVEIVCRKCRGCLVRMSCKDNRSGHKGYK